MATKTRQFDMFGIYYRTRQFAAVPALAVLAARQSAHPLAVLERTEVLAGRDYVPLDSRAAINEHVRDIIEQLPPRTVLFALIKIVNNFNFSFMSTWKGVKIPLRFRSDSNARSTESENVAPLIAQIAGDGVATMKELEEYYSLEDAFKMFDVIIARDVNEALANESSISKR